jgi:glycosyltransferase involved in cell wall biosynthesis
MRVLASAYACEPGRGSEPGVGWNWVCQIARFHEVWVITRENNREPIESALRRERMPGVHWEYYDLPRWARFWKRGRRGVQTYYYLWQIGAYLHARNLHRRIAFDITHHLTLVKYWVPSFLALLPIPFIWGPVGGGEVTPPRFRSSLPFRGQIYEHLRNIAQAIAHFDPFLRLTARRAVLALACTEETKRRLASLGCCNVLVFSQVGLSAREIEQLGQVSATKRGNFRVLSVGSLLHLKGFDMAIKAFARLHQRFPNSQYWLIGEGPQRPLLQSLARELGVADAVRFPGSMPRSELLTQLREYDVLLHPVLHDSGGCASVEAMAAGLPVVCLDVGGPALQVTSKTGIKVSAQCPEQAIADLAAALTQLATDENIRLQFGRAAQRRVEKHFNWDRKGEYLPRLYSSSLPFTNGPIQPLFDSREA